MDPSGSQDDFQLLRRQKSGQKVCPRCQKSYNNRAVPYHCTESNCGAFLGGSYKPPEKVVDAKLLTSSIVSVRQNPAGIPTRVFVDLRGNKVCLNIKLNICKCACFKHFNGPGSLRAPPVMEYLEYLLI